MAKDLRLAQEAAAASGQETPFGAEAAKRFTAFAEAGDGDLDFFRHLPGDPEELDVRAVQDLRQPWVLIADLDHG